MHYVESEALGPWRPIGSLLSCLLSLRGPQPWPDGTVHYSTVQYSTELSSGCGGFSRPFAIGLDDAVKPIKMFSTAENVERLKSMVYVVEINNSREMPALFL